MKKVLINLQAYTLLYVKGYMNGPYIEYYDRANINVDSHCEKGFYGEEYMKKNHGKKK